MYKDGINKLNYHFECKNKERNCNKMLFAGYLVKVDRIIRIATELQTNNINETGLLYIGLPTYSQLHRRSSNVSVETCFARHSKYHT